MPSIVQINPPYLVSHSHPANHHSHPMNHTANSTTNPSSGSTQPDQVSLTAAPTASLPTSNSSNPSTPVAPKKRITATIKNLLRDYFTASNWPLNKLLSRGKRVILIASYRQFSMSKVWTRANLQGSFEASKQKNMGTPKYYHHQQLLPLFFQT